MATCHHPYRLARACVVAAIVALSGVARAETTPPAEPPVAQSAEQKQAEQQQAEIKAAWAEADKAATVGPTSIKLLDQAELKIPQGTAYVPAAEAARILRAYGNTVGDGHVGLVTGTGEHDEWIAMIEFVKDGYVKDDEANDWNADDLLASIRQGTGQANEERASRGFPKLDVVGWIEKPTYDAATRRLVWSLATKLGDAPADMDNGVEYNTYALGRDGYVSIGMITTQGKIASHKPIAQSLLANLSYLPGKRYQDFDPATDNAAAYGIAALVGGALIAKKLGLLGVMLAFVAKFAKIGLILLAAVGAGFGVAFGATYAKMSARKKARAEAAPSGDGS